jgi:hypothetical protein
VALPLRAAWRGREWVTRFYRRTVSVALSGLGVVTGLDIVLAAAMVLLGTLFLALGVSSRFSGYTRRRAPWMWRGRLDWKRVPRRELVVFFLSAGGMSLLGGANQLLFVPSLRPALLACEPWPYVAGAPLAAVMLWSLVRMAVRYPARPGGDPPGPEQ